MTTKKLWIGFIAVMAISFAVLLFFGREIYKQAPPVPDKVVTTSGKVSVYRAGHKRWTECLAVARWPGNGNYMGTWGVCCS